MKGSKGVFAVSSVAAAVLFGTTIVFADAGGPGGTTGGSCANWGSGTTGGYCTTVWYKYTYTSGKSNFDATYIPAGDNRGTADWGISAAIGVKDGATSDKDNCYGKSNTFYAKGAAAGYTDGSKVTILYKSQQFGSAQASYKGVYTNPVSTIENPGSLGDNYSYAFGDKIKISPSYWGPTYNMVGYLYDDGGTLTNDLTTTHGNIVAQGHIVSTVEAGKAFCKAAKKDEDCEAWNHNDIKIDGYNFQGDNPATWFCGYDNTKNEGFTKATTTIVAKRSDGTEIVKASVSEQGNSKRDDQSKTVDALDSSTVTIVTTYKAERDDSQTVTPGYTKDNNPKWSSYIWANSGANSKEEGRFDRAALTVDNGTETRTATITLNPGDKKTVCSSIQFDHHYQNNDGIVTWLPTDDPNYDQTACITIEYSKPVTAEVDSDTIATIDSEYLDPTNTKTVYYSHEAGEADKTMQYPDVRVKPGPIYVTWGHYLGYKNLTGSASSVWSTTYNLQGGAGLYHKLEIGPYSNPGATLSNYKWQYFYDNLDGNGEYPSASASHTQNKRREGVFPGEQATISQTLKHPAKVNAGDGSKADGSGEEQSKVEMTIKASDITCGLDATHSYQIGVNNANDYRWMIMQRNSSEKVVVGDYSAGTTGVSAAATMWFRPRDEISISQVACFGSQIKLDATQSGDKWYNNPWGSDKTSAANSKFVMNGSGLEDIKKTHIFSEFTSQPSHLSTDGNASLWATEVGSNPINRIANNYKLTAYSGGGMISPWEDDHSEVDNLGKNLEVTFAKPDTSMVSINAKVPYNYGLNMGFKSSPDVLFDDEATFKAEISTAERVNERVCNGDDKDTAPSSCDPYATKTKKTQTGLYVFTMGIDFKLSELTNKSDFTVNGNILNADPYTVGDRIRHAVLGQLGREPQEIAGGGGYTPGSSDLVLSSEHPTDEITGKTINASDYPVGTKLCAVVAAYPSDSHNYGNNNPIPVSDNVQASALTSSTEGMLTKMHISCRTVAKRQTMSVEGNGIIATGGTKSSNIEYKGKDGKKRTYRSWTEYQLIGAGENTFSSGAVAAYNLAYTESSPNERIAPEKSSVPTNSALNIQSFGNMIESDDASASVEASSAWGHSLNLIKDIIEKYGSLEGTSSNNCGSGLGGNLPNNNYLICAQSDNLVSSNHSGKDTITIKKNGTLNITPESHLDDWGYWGNPKRIIIIAEKIHIDPNVTNLKAWLIVTGIDYSTGNLTTGELNTCGDNKIDNGENSVLLDNCNNSLYINGPVIVNGKVLLPRVFGGGSVYNDTSFGKDPYSLSQRAEIFDYDPEVIKWAYDESRKSPHMTTTYTESLAPRL